MTMKTNCPSVGAVLVLNAFSATATGQTVWDLADDWSDKQNPNGPWSYNAGAEAIPTHFDDWFGKGNPAWAAALPPEHGHIPAWGKLGVGITCDMEPGDVFTHANDPAGGNGVDLANVTWTSPTCGDAEISGTLWWAECLGHGGRTMDWRLYFNDALMDSGNIGEGDPWSRMDPLTFGFVENLSEGDVVKLEFERTHIFGTMATVAMTVTMPPAVPCPHDLDGDGTVGIGDFLIVLGDWGGCLGDTNGDQTTDILDFLAVIGNWGPCP